MSWIVTPALARLMADFRAVFPAKSRASDGTIGDAAHQAETSGHNPDDTPGSRAEYSDADSRAEVRAIDVDNDLRDPGGASMEDVVQRMLRTPADLARLMYIIYNRRIWRRRNGWRQEAYTGSSPHTEHAHFSGDPDTDEDASPWSSVLSFREDDMLRDETIPGTATPGMGDRNAAILLSDMWNAIMRTRGMGGELWADSPFMRLLAAAAEDKVRDTALAAAVQALAVGAGIDPDALMARVEAAVVGAVKPLQEQLAAVQARNLKLAQALAAAGGALDAADD